MIHETLKEMCEAAVPELNWSTAFYFANNNTGTVSLDGGGDPHLMDGDITYPSFGVLIRSSDWDLAETAAYKVFNLLHKQRNEIMYGYLYEGGESLAAKKQPSIEITYQVMLIANRGGIMELGITEDNVREMKLIFDTQLFKLKEEEL